MGMVDMEGVRMNEAPAHKKCYERLAQTQWIQQTEWDYRSLVHVENVLRCW